MCSLNCDSVLEIKLFTYQDYAIAIICWSQLSFGQQGWDIFLFCNQGFNIKTLKTIPFRNLLLNLSHSSKTPNQELTLIKTRAKIEEFRN